MEGKLGYNQRLYDQLHEAVSPELQQYMDSGKKLTPEVIVDIAKSIRVSTLKKRGQPVEISIKKVRRDALQKPEDKQELQQRVDWVQDICSKYRFGGQPPHSLGHKRKEPTVSEVPAAPPPPSLPQADMKRTKLQGPPPPAPPMPPLAPPPPFMGRAGAPLAPPVPQAPLAPPPPAPFAPPAPQAPAAPFAPPAPPQMQVGIKRKESEAQPQVEDPNKRVKLSRSHEYQVAKPAVPEYTEEEFFLNKPGEGGNLTIQLREIVGTCEEMVKEGAIPWELGAQIMKVAQEALDSNNPEAIASAIREVLSLPHDEVKDLESRLVANEVREVLEGVKNVGLMPTDFARVLMDKVESLASVMPNSQEQQRNIEGILENYRRESQEQEIGMIKDVSRNLLGIPDDQNVQIKLNELIQSRQQSPKNKLLKELLDDNKLNNAEASLVTELLKSYDPKRQKEIINVLLGDGQRTGTIDQGILLEKIREREQEAGYNDLTSLLRKKVSPDDMSPELETALDNIASDLYVDFLKLSQGEQTRYFTLEGIDSDAVSELVSGAIPDPIERERIVKRILTPLQQRFHDNLNTVYNRERINPDSPINKLATESFERALTQLNSAAKTLPGNHPCRELIDDMYVAYSNSESAQNENDQFRDAFQQVTNQQYTFADTEADGQPKRFTTGGFGVVYKILKAGENKGDEPIVHMLKVLKKPISPEEWKMYQPEGVSLVKSFPPQKGQKQYSEDGSPLKSIQHPNVLTPENILYNNRGEVIGVVTEFVKGSSLKKILKELTMSRKPYENTERAKEILRDIASGLKALHDQQIAHLDFHSDNILLGDKGGAKVMDFDTSLFVEKGEAVGIKEKGDNEFLAPEIMRDQLVTTKADVYGFGVMIYEMLEGAVPIGYENVKFDRIKDPSLQQLLRGFLAEDAENRPTIDEFFNCPFFQ